MLLADCTDTGALRGYARATPNSWTPCWHGTAARPPTSFWAPATWPSPSTRARTQNRHQGIVTIEGDNLAEMALHYFRTSEQLRCFVHLACERDRRTAGAPAR